MKLKIFGKLTDIFNGNEYDFPVEKNISVFELKQKLAEKFPELIETTYLIAVNEVQTTDDAIVSDISEIVLLPPYSGG